MALGQAAGPTSASRSSASQGSAGRRSSVGCPAPRGRSRSRDHLRAQAFGDLDAAPPTRHPAPAIEHGHDSAWPGRERDQPVPRRREEGSRHRQQVRGWRQDMFRLRAGNVAANDHVVAARAAQRAAPTNATGVARKPLPASRCGAPAPIAATSPAASPPRTWGEAGMRAPQAPAGSRRRNGWSVPPDPGRGVGSSSRCRASGPPVTCMCIAGITSPRVHFREAPADTCR